MALIQEPAVILRILRHLGLPEAVPVMRPARDPPLPLALCDDSVLSDDTEPARRSFSWLVSRR